MLRDTGGSRKYKPHLHTAERHYLQTFQQQPRAKEVDAGGAGVPIRESRKVKSALVRDEQSRMTRERVEVLQRI